MNTLIHMCWAVALPALLQEEKGIMKKTFIWPSSLLLLCAVWVKLIKNITGSADGLFPENLGPIRVLDHLSWTMAMVHIYKTCSNPAELLRTQQRQGSPETYTPYPHPFQIMSFTFITSEGSPLSPVPGISMVPLTSASENLTTTWNTYHPKKVQELLWCTKSWVGTPRQCRNTVVKRELNHTTNGVTFQSCKEQVHT